MKELPDPMQDLANVTHALSTHALALKEKEIARLRGLLGEIETARKKLGTDCSNEILSVGADWKSYALILGRLRDSIDEILSRIDKEGENEGYVSKMCKMCSGTKKINVSTSRFGIEMIDCRECSRIDKEGE